MSSYSHSNKKFADSGLQLRVPVDLVPDTQYSRLTNAIPVIEGELRAREGLTLLEPIYPNAYVNTLGRASLATTDVTYFYPVFAGYRIGDQISLTLIGNSANSGVFFPLGTFQVTITGAAPPNGSQFTGYQFTPAITGSTWGGGLYAAVFAQATSANVFTTLPNTTITNLFRLNQSVPGFTGDRLAVMAGRIFRAPLPDGDAFTELLENADPTTPAISGLNLSGNTVAIISFRFTDDSATWAIIADQFGMFKYRENPGGLPYFFKLGYPVPPDAASASDGGAGLLDSTGGTGYDWRYTWRSSITNTESNPSPITVGPPDTKRPLSFTNPSPGNDPVSSPGNAIDGSVTTFTTASGTVETIPRDPETGMPREVDISSEGCIYRNTTNPSSPPSADVILSVIYDATKSGGTGGVSARISVSQDGGTTYKSLVNETATVAQTTATLKLDTGIDYQNIRVQILATGLTGGIDNPVTMQLRVYDIVIQTSATTGALTLVNKKALVCVDSPNSGTLPSINDGQIDSIRLYRRGGSLTDAWRLVGTFALAGLTQGACSLNSFSLTDNVSDTALSVMPIMNLDNDQPVTSVTTKNQSLPFIWGPVGLEARVLGCGDPNRPECVYWSKPGNPDAWPPQNFVEVCDPGTPMVAGCVYNTRVYGFSREGVYELVEGLGVGTTFAPFKTPSAHGLYSPWGLATGPAIYFVSKDGIYMTTGGQETSLVENDIKPLWPTYDSPARDVAGYEAIDMTQPDAMRLRYHNDELWFGYVGATSGQRKLLIYDIIKKRWRAAEYTCSVSEIYSEPSTVSSLLMGSLAGNVYQTGGDTDPSALGTLSGVSAIRANGGTLAHAVYEIMVSRSTALGEVALSNEILVNTTIQNLPMAISVTLPAIAGTISWRVYFGIGSGQESQYQDFTEAVVAATGNRTVVVLNPGTAGTPPTMLTNTDIRCLLRTGAHDMGVPLNRKQFGNVLFDVDPGGGAITITPLTDGETQTESALTVTGNGRKQAPLDLSDFFAFNTEYEISFSRSAGINPVLFQYDTLWMLEPVGVIHWQSQPTSFAFPGYVHVRDGYIALRSNSVVTLTMTIDGVDQPPYTIASTGDERLKIYVQFAANKGLMYKFSLDAAVEFRTYEEDLEIRCKPWLGLLGYAIMRTLGGEQKA